MYPQNPSLSILYSFFVSLSLSWKNAKQKQTGGKSSFYLPPEIEKQGKSITEEVPAQSIQEASKNFAYTREWKRRRKFFFISLLFAEKRKKDTISRQSVEPEQKKNKAFFGGKKKKKIHWVFRNWK